ncbi:hypothetical protein BZA70DRAFT_128939 [Myxozyma melibiosi]|uniref:VHS domain-containing protein n=1 Tax=Myxozyma melibiosi TaxID=54550 RepID=A0ABR1F8W1_9ASCO
MKVFRSSSGSAKVSASDPRAQVTLAIAGFCDKKRSGTSFKSIFHNTSASASAAPSSAGEDDDVTLLPVIVECAQSSPQAAAEAVRSVRKRIDPKHSSNPIVQYNAILVLRILGSSNSTTILDQIGLDGKLATAVSNLLAQGNDPSVRAVLIETLEYFQREQRLEENLVPLKLVFEQYMRKNGGKTTAASTAENHHQPRSLSPEKVADVIEEAKSSAGLLQQVVQTTAPAEISASPLVLEFYERCVRLSSKIESYLSRDVIPPLEESMTVKLIDANESLSSAIEMHKSALDRAANLVSAPREFYVQQEPTPARTEPSAYNSIPSSISDVSPDVARRTQLEYTPIQPRQQELQDPFADDDDEDSLWVGCFVTVSLRSY